VTRYFIYALTDPRTDAVAKIGITDNAYERFKKHMSLPRFDGVGKCGIYSTEGGECAKATENLHAGV
jgi:hypothetical protein